MVSRRAAGCRAGRWHQRAAQGRGRRASWWQLTRRLLGAIILGAPGPRGGGLLAHGGENVGPLVGRGGRGLGRPEFPPHAAKKGPESAGAGTETLRRQAPGAPGAILDPSPPRGAHWAAADRRVGPAAYPRGKRVRWRPGRPMEAPRGEDARERRGWSPRHVGEVDAGDARERGPEGTGGCVTVRVPRRGRRWGQGRGGRIDAGRTRAEDARDGLRAVGDVLRGKGLERQRVCQRAKRGRPVIPRERLGQRFWPGFAAGGPRLREGMGLALASDDRAAQTHARHAGHSTQNVRQRPRHLLQGLLPRLPRLAPPLAQRVSMAEATTALTPLLGRTTRGCKHPITMERLPPSTSKAIGLGASRDMLDVAGVDQGHRAAARLQPLPPRNPGDARRFHHARREPPGRQPVGETMPSTGKGTKWLERLALAVCRPTDPMLLSAHSKACGRGMHKGHVRGSGCGLLALVGHRGLPSGDQWGRARDNRASSAQGYNRRRRAARCDTVSS